MVHSYGWKDGDTWALLRLRVQFLPSGVEDINSFVLLRNTSVFKLRKEIRMRKRRRKSQPAFPFHSFSLCPYLLSVFPFYSLWWTCAPWNAWEFSRFRDKKPFHFKIWLRQGDQRWKFSPFVFETLIRIHGKSRISFCSRSTGVLTNIGFLPFHLSLCFFFFFSWMPFNIWKVERAVRFRSV